MDLDKLYRILDETTVLLRQGEEVTEEQIGRTTVTTIQTMPHESEAPTLEKIDLALVTVGVDRQKAEERKEAFLECLRQYPDQAQLKGGPSYIHLGAEIGDQGAALRMMALGAVLEIWQLMTPMTMGFNGKEARDYAGTGFLFATGYRGEE